MAQDPERSAQLKREFIATRGFWSEAYEGLAKISPDFFEAHLRLSSIATKSKHLSAKFLELIAIAIDASTTHLYEPGLRIHIRNALRLGATQEEIVEVFQLASGIGIHSLLVGLPLLAEACGDGPAPASKPAVLKERFLRTVGIWTNAHEELLVRAPDYFEAYLDFVCVPWTSEILPMKEKCLIGIALAASVTYLREDDISVYMKRALSAGAMAGEIVEVLQRVSGLGMHACMLGVPILLDEATSRG